LFAVKIPKQEHRANKEVIRLFLAEGEIHRQITDHPHIVKYIASGCEDDEYFYAMEFIRGVRLKRWIEDKGRFPEKTGWQIGLELLSALSHIYACGFLYRDLNAGNVMLKSDGHSVLFDFGLAMKIEEAARPVAVEAHIWGSGEFLPPERVYRKGEKASSAIYSLGLLMYFLLSGENFMKSDSARGLAKRHVSAVRMTLNPSLLQGCSENTLNVINMMIEPNPEDRFQTFEELESTVKELLSVL
ncbi:MAG: serine/threonine protein kinase, partial [Lentisphaerae bacterium]|nr:serine/threonine protein kinase [Lentisphaerota bacterium]